MCEVNPFVIYKKDNPDPNSIKDPHNGNFYYCWGNKNLYIYMCKWIQINIGLTQSFPIRVSISNIYHERLDVYPYISSKLVFTATFYGESPSPIIINSGSVSCGSKSYPVEWMSSLPLTINRFDLINVTLKFDPLKNNLDDYWFHIFNNTGGEIGSAFFWN